MEIASRITLTADGSHSVYNLELNKPYHSIFGAVQESEWVYIELGLRAALTYFEGDLHVFEMGFGTGLNALLTARVAQQTQRKIYYTAIESQPLSIEEAHQLNYDQRLGTDYLNQMHEIPWGEAIAIQPYFTLTKRLGKIEDLQLQEHFQLVYYDAFAPTAQPELWTEDIFAKIATWLVPGGLLTTYSSKSVVQRALRKAGFRIEKHPGPFRKREIIRAVYAPAKGDVRPEIE